MKMGCIWVDVDYQRIHALLLLLNGDILVKDHGLNHWNLNHHDLIQVKCQTKEK